MNNIILTTALLLSVFTQKVFSQDSNRSSLISQYYAIKNALVSGNANTAVAKAQEFIKVVNGIDYKIISEGNLNILLKDAGRISTTTDIKKQRAYFSNLSANMIDVARAVKLSSYPIYLAYCPMKDAYWLSGEKGIKNPYYGTSMLTCGEVKETIQP